MMLELSPLLTAATAPAESMPLEAPPGDLATGELRAEPAEGSRVLIDDRDAVPDVLEPARDGGADASAAHHDHVHG
jgi:hypothetical protein